MEDKFDSILFKIDILGPEPKLNIFGDDKYKTRFSSICSIIVIAILIAFTIYSIVEFFEYKNPSIIYVKDNDVEMNRTINAHDSVMFAVLDVSDDTILNESQIYFVASYIIRKGDNVEYSPLTVERCEFGKNVDPNYKEQLSNYDLEHFYCIAENLNDYPLIYNSEGDTGIYLSIKLNQSSGYTPDDDLVMYFLNGNDVIDHKNDNDPFLNTYYTLQITDIDINKYNVFRYYFQYIRYDSDKGFIFESIHSYNAKSYSHMTNMKVSKSEMMDEDEIGAALIAVSTNNFDYYIRNYSRIQTLLAEILSVIELITGLGNMVCAFVLNKKMSRKVIKHILHRNGKVNVENDDKNTLDNSKDKTNYLDNQIQIKETNINLNMSSYNHFDKTSSNCDEERVIKVLNNSNYFNFIKSYLCFNDPNTLLINECHEQYEEEVRIENILKRIYESEARIDCIEAILNENNLKAKHILKNERFGKIIELVDRIENKNDNNRKT